MAAALQDLKQIALAGRVEKNGITLVVGRPLIPDLKTDASGTRGEVRFTVDGSVFVPADRSWSSRKSFAYETGHRTTRDAVGDTLQGAYDGGAPHGGGLRVAGFLNTSHFKHSFLEWRWSERDA